MMLGIGKWCEEKKLHGVLTHGCGVYVEYYTLGIVHSLKNLFLYTIKVSLYVTNYI